MPSGYTAEPVSCMNPASVDSSDRAEPPIASLASSSSTETPFLASSIAADNPFGPAPTTMASWLIWNPRRAYPSYRSPKRINTVIAPPGVSVDDVQPVVFHLFDRRARVPAQRLDETRGRVAVPEHEVAAGHPPEFRCEGIEIARVVDRHVQPGVASRRCSRRSRAVVVGRVDVRDPCVAQHVREQVRTCLAGVRDGRIACAVLGTLGVTNDVDDGGVRLCVGAYGRECERRQGEEEHTKRSRKGRSHGQSRERIDGGGRVRWSTEPRVRPFRGYPAHRSGATTPPQ